MIGNQFTFWEYMAFPFIAVLSFIIEYWFGFLMLGALVSYLLRR